MAIPTNYATLQTWLLDWVARPDMSSVVPEWIKMAEGELNDRLKIRRNEVTTTLSLTSGTSTVSLPSNYLEHISLNIADSLDDQPQKRDTEFVDQLRADPSASAGRPRWYAITGEATLTFDRAADQTYSLSLRYYKAWNIASDDTNWILTNKPAIYLGLCLKWAGMYVKEPNGVALWMAEADKDIDLLITADRRERSKGLTARVDSALRSRGAWNVNTDSFVSGD